jgi:tetratricopeptide (TPR) repeat protein
MKILSTTLLGPGSEKTVTEAILSVLDEVQGCIFIDGGGGVQAVERAQQIAGDKYLSGGTYKWHDNYGDARTFALNQARSYGATFALTLDTDERVHLAHPWKAIVESQPNLDVFIVPDKTEGYHKERLIRCASKANWYGPVCEMLRGFHGPQGKLPGYFVEVEKTDLQHKARHERGVRLMRTMLETENDYRWHHHLGACLLNLGSTTEARESFIAASLAAKSSETKAWARYRAAECLILEGKIEEAYELSARGLAGNSAFIKDFGWLLAYCHKQMGDLEMASHWAQLALAAPKQKTRISHISQTWEQGCLALLQEIHHPPGTLEGDATADTEPPPTLKEGRY